MPKSKFDLYLDESGSFVDGTIDPQRPGETSLVGGILVKTGEMTNELAMELLPHHVHCCQEYKKYYIDVLERLTEYGYRLVIFENKERIRVVNGDTTYLNIISEGLVPSAFACSRLPQEWYDLDGICIFASVQAAQNRMPSFKR